ncbi:MAG: hypothetical protein AAF742_08780, partial [Pseudomonadota bacterium]
DRIREVGSKAPTDPAASLAYGVACRDLGEHVAGERLHPCLLMLIGQLSAQGAPVVQSGLSRSNGHRPFEVEITLGKAPTDEVKDPINWLFATSEDLDPLGWTILARLGLSASFSLRDSVTRMYLTQDRLRAELAFAIARLDENLKAAKLQTTDTKKPIFAPITQLRDQHLSIDLPLHPALAVTTHSTDRQIDDATLSMLQMSLRPLPAPNSKTVYEIAAVKTVPGRKQPYQLVSDIDMELILIDRGYTKLTLEADKAIVVDAHLLRTGVIVARYKSPDSFSAAERLKRLLSEDPAELYDAERSKTLAPRAESPVAFTTLEEPEVYTPFGQFDFDKTPLLPNELQPEYSGPLKPFFNLLLRSFVKETDSKDVRDAFKKALNDKIMNDDSVIPQIMTGLSRFFPAALPAQMIEVLGIAKQPFHPLRVTLAAPEELLPLRMSPDKQGWFSYTHRIKEDWATKRGYGVRALPRDWGFNPKSRELPQISLSEDQGRIDVKFDRVRNVIPPKSLGARVVGSLAYPLYEVAFSEPAERALSRSGIPFANKLEFQDFRFRMHGVFQRADWFDRLVKLGLATTLQRPKFERILDSKAKKDDDGNELPKREPAVLPAPETREVGLLQVTPAVRFGAAVFRVTAEPYYYAQTMTAQIRAGVRISEATSVALPTIGPAPLAPLEHDNVKIAST